MSEVNIDARIFSAMQTGEPYSVYQKTIVGKVYVTILSPFDHKPQGMILSGMPKDKTAKVELWSEKEDVFFKRANAKHFELGNIIEVKQQNAKEVVTEKSIEQFSDEELSKVLNGTYASFQKTLRKCESEAVVYRLLTMAEEQEKPSKLVDSIKARLAELQSL
ncbi:MAG: hypothetical protein GYA36_18345 [Veillonellaceae bacterium]|nr:hypothetical protein [Veillonellaceae bacterium]